MIGIYTEILINFRVSEAFTPTILTSFPKINYIRKWNIIELIFCRKIYNNEGYSILPFEFTHELYLMYMNVLYRKCISSTFFCIKAYRNSLNDTNIVNRTFLVEICQCILIGFIGVGIFWTSARCEALYLSLDILIRSSNVEPLSPLEFQVGITVLLS